MNFQRNGVKHVNSYEVVQLTNIFIPWTRESDFASHEAEAMSMIKQFAAKMEQLVQQRVII